MKRSLTNSTYSVLCAAFLFMLFIVLMPNQAAAQITNLTGTIELEGFAWSSTIGWISMNCSNTDTCVGGSAPGTKVNYAVTIDSATGNLSGHAWSPHIGWIRFNPSGPYPTSATGVANNSARATGDITSSVNLTGWARACVVFSNPNNCAGSLSSNAGGWDGWIALRGTAAGGYGVTMTPTGATASSYAWGGPIVMGWIDFSPAGADPVEYAELPSDLILGTVTTQLNNPTNTDYDAVDFTFAVSDVPITATNVPYTITLAGLPNVTGTFNGTDAVGGVVTINDSFANVPYGATPLNWEVTVDAPAPGVVNEGGGAAEINRSTGTIIPEAPDPEIDITLPDFVRAGETADVEIAVNAPYNTTCELFGPGFSSPSTNFTVSAGVPYSNTFTTAALSNAANIVVRCTVPVSSPYSESSSVEVIGIIEEV